MVDLDKLCMEYFQKYEFDEQQKKALMEKKKRS